MEIWMLRHSINGRRLLKTALAALAAASLAGCVVQPVQPVAALPPPMPRLFVYPAHGQSPDQLAHDRYDCHVWAVQQTGVDPTGPNTPAYDRASARWSAA